MSGTPTNAVTVALEDLSHGKPDAANRLADLVYAEMRQIAAAQMKHERPGHTLQTTALANEAFIRLIGGQQVEFKNRAHFFAAAANAMRRILIDHARERAAAKRGGGRQRVDLEQAVTVAAPTEDVDLLALNESMERLAKHSQRQARVVELKFFGSLTAEEAAEVLGISPRQVESDWAFAKAWLRRDMEAGGSVDQ